MANQFNQNTNSLHLVHTNETIDLNYLNIDYDCTPRKSLVGDLDLYSQQNAISFSFEAFFEAFSYLPDMPGSTLFSDFANSFENLELWNHIFSKCQIHSEKSCGETSNVIIKYLLQPSFVDGYVQVGVPGPGLWNGLVGILLADFYQKSNLDNSWDILGQVNDQVLGNPQLKEILLDISNKFGFGNSSGIACLSLLETLNHASDTKYYYSQVSGICRDLIEEAVRDHFESNSSHTLSFKGELDLYDGLLGTISSVLTCADEFQNNGLISKLLEKWSLELTESILCVNRLDVGTSYSSLSKCLRSLSLAHGHIGTAIAFQRIGVTGNRIDTLMNQMFQALELFFEKLPNINSASNSSIKVQQSLIANCNGLGGIALGLAKLDNQRAKELVTLCSKSICNSLSVIQNQLADQSTKQGSSLAIHCDSPLTNMQSINPLDHSLCCGISGTLTTLTEISKCCEFNSGLQELINSHSEFLMQLLSSYKKELVEGRQVIPHRRDLSLFKGLGGVLLALDKKFQLCSELATLEIYSEHMTI